MAPSALYFATVRHALRHRDVFDKSIAPFFQRCHPFTLKWVLSEQPRLERITIAARMEFEKQLGEGRSVSKMDLKQLIRVATAMPDAKAAGLDALGWLEMMKERVQLVPEPPTLPPALLAKVGDIVVRSDVEQRGVVADVIPYCFQSVQWVHRYLGSMDDKRLTAPWYLVLVEHSNTIPLDFTRYASSLTHFEAKPNTLTATAGAEIDFKPNKSIGLHRFLPLFFHGFDSEKGTYVPHTKEELSMSAVRWRVHYAPGTMSASHPTMDVIAAGSHAMVNDE